MRLPIEAITVGETPVTSALALGVVLLVLFGVLIVLRRTKCRRAFRAAERALLRGDTRRALIGFDQAAAILKSRPLRGGEHIMLRRALVASGDIERGRKNRQRAFERYSEARAAGAELPAAAQPFMGQCYAEKDDRSKEALGLYLSYARSGPFTGPHSDKVFAVLQSACQVRETMKGVERRAAAELNRRALEANPSFEWASYFLGLALLLDGRAQEAATYFEKARLLNPARTLTCYWLAVCRLQRPEPDLDGAMQMIDEFLSAPGADGRHLKRQASICAEIGKLLVQRLGGFDAAVDCSSDEHCPTLARAVYYFETATARGPDSAEYHYLLGRSRVLAGALGPAIAALERASALAPNEKLYHFRLGVERQKAGQLSAAAEALEAALTIDPEWTDALDRAARLSLEIGRFDRAEAHAALLLSRRDRRPDLVALLLRALYAQNKHAQVVREVEAPAAEPLSVARFPEAAFVVARSYAALGQFDRAVVWYPDLPDKPAARYYHGCAFAGLGRFEEARACFNAVAGSGGEYAGRALLQRGNLHLETGERERAAADYAEALRKSPEDAHIHYALGVFAATGGDHDAAAEHFKRAATLSPADFAFARAVTFALAVTEERRGESERAREYYRQVIDDSELGRPAALRLGVLACRAGNHVEALGYLGRCAEAGDDSETLLFYRGTALLFSGRIEEAIRDWTRVAERKPDNERVAVNLARARYLLGVEQVRAGRLADAAESWRHYLEQYPADEKTRRDVAQIHFRLAISALRETDSPDVSKAACHLDEALRYDGTDPVYSLYAALCKLRSGDAVACRARLDELVQAGHQKPRILYNLAVSLLHQSETERAVQILHEVASAGPAEPYARYAAWALANEYARQSKLEEAIDLFAAVPPESDLERVFL